MPIEKTVVKKRAYKKRATSKKATKTKPVLSPVEVSTPAPKKSEVIPILKTVITIAPDGVITISKVKELHSEVALLSKSEP